MEHLLHFDGEQPNAPLDKVFVAGAVAGVVQCSIATPMELVVRTNALLLLPNPPPPLRSGLSSSRTTLKP